MFLEKIGYVFRLFLKDDRDDELRREDGREFQLSGARDDCQCSKKQIKTHKRLKMNAF